MTYCVGGCLEVIIKRVNCYKRQICIGVIMTAQSESIKSIDETKVMHPNTDLNSLREQGPFIV